MWISASSPTAVATALVLAVARLVRSIASAGLVCSNALDLPAPWCSTARPSQPTMPAANRWWRCPSPASRRPTAAAAKCSKPAPRNMAVQARRADWRRLGVEYASSGVGARPRHPRPERHWPTPIGRCHATQSLGAGATASCCGSKFVPRWPTMRPALAIPSQPMRPAANPVWPKRGRSWRAFRQGPYPLSVPLLALALQMGFQHYRLRLATRLRPHLRQSLRA